MYTTLIVVVRWKSRWKPSEKEQMLSNAIDVSNMDTYKKTTTQTSDAWNAARNIQHMKATNLQRLNETVHTVEGTIFPLPEDGEWIQTIQTKIIRKKNGKTIEKRATPKKNSLWD